MELFRYGPRGQEHPALRDDSGATFGVGGITGDFDGSFFAGDGIERLREALAAGSLPEITVAGERIGPPIACPTAIVCIGMNYAAHAAESAASPPERPIVFFKHPSAIVGPEDDLMIPPGSEKTDWEVELAVVMSGTPRRLKRSEDALDYVAGYTIIDDVSERAFQIEASGGQWSKGKAYPSFAPIGPVIRPAEELDPGDLRLRSWVNGDRRQDSSTADMIFSVAELILDLSYFMDLMPGDVIATGTPEGVALSGRYPYLGPGDVVELEIEGLGRQRQKCVFAQSSS
jgi:2-keto-4-pentenoate hydratase/2-oxohepta-3-ene-1,7-dioic acid hydratase in catechol pathway